MSLEKLNIPTKIDNAAKQRLVASNVIGTNETLLANEVNDIVAKTNELVEAYNFGAPITAFNFKKNIATYADLLLIEEIEVNDAYGVQADGLVYVWNGNEFPGEGNGINLGLNATGRIELGETQAVSGNEVSKSFLDNRLITFSENRADNLIKGYVTISNTNGNVSSSIALCQFDISVSPGVYAFKGKRVNRLSDLNAISVLGKKKDGTFIILLNGITTGYEEVGKEIYIEIPISNQIESVSVSYLLTSAAPSFYKINGLGENLKTDVTGFSAINKSLLIDKFRLNATNGVNTISATIASSPYVATSNFKFIELTLPVATQTNFAGIVFYDENYNYISGSYNDNFRYTDLFKKIKIPENAISFKTCFNLNIIDYFECVLRLEDALNITNFNDIVKKNANKVDNLIKGYVTETNTNGNPTTGNHVCQFDIPLIEGEKYIFHGIVPVASNLSSISTVLGIKRDGSFIELVDAYTASNPKNGTIEKLTIYPPKDVTSLSVTFNSKSVKPSLFVYEKYTKLSNVLEEIDTPINSNNAFKGLKVLTFGSSNLTDTAGTWSQDLCTDLEMVLSTRAVGGSKYAYFPEYDKKSVVERVEDYLSETNGYVPDVIILSTGLNDSYHAPVTPIGDWNIVQGKTIQQIRETINDNSFGVSTFYGALKYVIEALQDRLDNCLIIVNIPFQVWKGRADGFNPYVEPLKTVANYYSVPIINSWEEGGIIRKYEKYNVVGRFTVDGVHVKYGGLINETGRALQQNFMISRFKTIYYNKKLQN